jgi:amino-acid N-acetyltransferase
MGLSKLFVLTTRSIHWFQERGFTPVDIDLLPESKKRCTTISAAPRC